MANTYRSGNANAIDLADDDPFAELTHIMGRERHQLGREGLQDDLLGMELEKELLGDLGDLEVLRHPSGTAAMRDREIEPQAAETEPDEQVIDAEFAAAFDAEFGGGDMAGDTAPEAEAFALTNGAGPDREPADFGDAAMAPLDTDFSAGEPDAFGDFSATEDDEALRAAAPRVDTDFEPEMDAPASAWPFDNADAGAPPLAEEASAASAGGDDRLAIEEVLEAEPLTAEGAQEPFDYVKAAADRHDFLEHALEDGTSGAHDEPLFAGVPEDGPQEAERSDDETATPAGDTFDGAALAAAAGDRGAPEIDTLEIAERPAPVADDLDIPEPEAQAEPAGEFDELAAELAGAFGEMDDAPLSPQQPPVAEDGADDLFFGEPLAAVSETDGHGGGSDAPADAAAYGAAYEPPLGHEPGVERDEAFTPPAARQTASRRGLLAAALAVAGVVVVGGAGLWAFSGGEAGTGKPAVIKASDDPVKVKPKNPGGTSVPEQSNEVYQRAAGASTDTPEQKQLVTTAEQPIDLQRTVQPRIVEARRVTPDEQSGTVGDTLGATPAPDTAGTADNTLGTAPVPETAGTSVPKAEDRLEPAGADAAPTAATDDTIAVQPHMVNTYIVKPDGTLVPREEPAPQAGTTTAETSGDGNAGALASTQPQGADDTDAEAASAASTADAAPSAEDAPLPSARPAEPAATQEVAAASTPAEKPLAPAATAAAGGWSVQIASQPTAAGAQESYQTLARRYGDILAGRGVNIVKADIEGMGTYYRVRIPSASKDDAIGLCTRLKSAGGSCFVSK